VRAWLCLWACLAASVAAAPIPVQEVLRIDGLDQPTALAVAPDGRLYVADAGDRVHVFTADGRPDFVFDGGPGTLDGPMGLAVDGRWIYVADSDHHRILRFDRRGRLRGEVPLRLPAVPGDTAPPEPTALALDGEWLWWSDRRHHRVCRTRLADGRSQCHGGRGTARGRFLYPYALVPGERGRWTVVDVLNARVQTFDRRGRVIQVLGGLGWGAGRLFRPNGLARAEDGRWFVGDAYRGTVSVFAAGRFQGHLDLRAQVPVGLAWHGGRLYLAEAGAGRVRAFRVGDSGPATRPAAAPVARACARCHLRWLPGAPADGNEPAPVARRAMCYSCHHGVVRDHRRRIGRGHQHPQVHDPQPRERARPAGAPRPDPLPEGLPRLSDGDHLTCASCHTPHAEGDATPTWMRYPGRGSDPCRACHRSHGAGEGRHNHPQGVRLAKPPRPDTPGYARDPRLQKGLPEALVRAGARLEADGSLGCRTCHTPHGATAAPLLVLDPARLCAACHPRANARGRDDARRRGVHPVAMDLEEPVSLAGRLVKRIGCLTCHRIHGARPHTAALRLGDGDGSLCAPCHGEDRQAMADGPHDLRRSAPEARDRHGRPARERGLCGGCHEMHPARPGVPALYTGEPPAAGDWPETGARDRLCLDCHRRDGIAEDTPVPRYQHPYRNLVMRADPAKTPLLDAADADAPSGRMGCPTCHDPHRWSVRDDRKPPPDADVRGTALDSFLRLRSVDEGFCKDCHGREARPRYLYFHDPCLGRPARNGAHGHPLCKGSGVDKSSPR